MARYNRRRHFEETLTRFTPPPVVPKFTEEETAALLQMYEDYWNFAREIYAEDAREVYAEDAFAAADTILTAQTPAPTETAPQRPDPTLLFD